MFTDIRYYSRGRRIYPDQLLLLAFCWTDEVFREPPFQLNTMNVMSPFSFKDWLHRQRHTLASGRPVDMFGAQFETEVKAMKWSNVELRQHNVLYAVRDWTGVARLLNQTTAKVKHRNEIFKNRNPEKCLFVNNHKITAQAGTESCFLPCFTARNTFAARQHHLNNWESPQACLMNFWGREDLNTTFNQVEHLPLLARCKTTHPHCSLPVSVQHFLKWN